VADGAVAVLDEISKAVEHAPRQRQELAVAAELTRLGIETIVGETIRAGSHGSAMSLGSWRWRPERAAS
jgi:hypothetical protein